MQMSAFVPFKVIFLLLSHLSQSRCYTHLRWSCYNWNNLFIYINKVNLAWGQLPYLLLLSHEDFSDFSDHCWSGTQLRPKPVLGLLSLGSNWKDASCTLAPCLVRRLEAQILQPPSDWLVRLLSDNAISGISYQISYHIRSNQIIIGCLQIDPSQGCLQKHCTIG